MKSCEKAKGLLLNGCDSCKYWMDVNGTSWNKSAEYSGCANLNNLKKVWDYEPEKLVKSTYEDIHLHINTFGKPVLLDRPKEGICEYFEFGKIKKWDRCSETNKSKMETYEDFEDFLKGIDGEEHI